MLLSKGLRKPWKAAWSVILRNQKRNCNPMVLCIEPLHLALLQRMLLSVRSAGCSSEPPARRCMHEWARQWHATSAAHASWWCAQAATQSRRSTWRQVGHLRTAWPSCHDAARGLLLHICVGPAMAPVVFSHAPAGGVVGRHCAGRAEPSYRRCVHSCTAPCLTHCGLPASPGFHGSAQQCGKRHPYMPPGGVLDQQLARQACQAEHQDWWGAPS